MELEVMTPYHPKWDMFIEKLSGPDGCNFHMKEKSKGTKKAATWTCHHGTNRPFSVAILSKMENIDIPETLKYFDEHGGNCDCEIIFNVDSLVL